MICARRPASVSMRSGVPGSMVALSARPFSSASGSIDFISVSTVALTNTRSGMTSTLPASIFERSRMSLISASRSLPADEIVSANSTCSGVRLPSLLSASSLARMSEELSGVRSSWLMLARNSFLYWLAFSSSSALLERVTCACARSSRCDLELLRLLFEMRVGLLQLGLLGLELRLRFLQRAALLLELLVADLELFLLRLQLLGLPLCLLEQLFQPGAVLRGTHGDGDGVRDALHQGLVLGSDPAQEAKLEHRMDFAIAAGRRHEQLARLALAQRGGNGQVARRHIANAHAAAGLGGLAQQAIARAQRVVLLRGRQRVAGNATEPVLAVCDVDRADLRVEVVREEIQHVLAEVFQALLALQAGGQPHLPRAQPDQELACAIVARGHDRGHRDQEQQERGASPGHVQREVFRLGPFGLPALEQLLLVGADLGGQLPHPVHQHLAAIGAQELHRSGLIARSMHRDRLAHLIHLLRGKLAERADALALLGIVGHEAAQGSDLVAERRPRVREGLEIGLAVQEQEAALARLGIFQCGENALELLDHRLRAVEEPDVGGARLQRGVEERRDHHDRHHRDHEAGHDGRRQRRAGVGARGRCVPGFGEEVFSRLRCLA